MNAKSSMSEQEWLNIFGDNLRDILREYGYSQREFSEATDISIPAINRYIMGQRIPNIRSFVNMSYELGIMFDEFMDFGYMID